MFALGIKWPASGLATREHFNTDSPITDSTEGTDVHILISNIEGPLWLERKQDLRAGQKMCA